MQQTTELINLLVKKEDVIKVFEFKIGDNIIYLIDSIIKILSKIDKIKIIIIDNTRP